MQRPVVDHGSDSVVVFVELRQAAPRRQPKAKRHHGRAEHQAKELDIRGAHGGWRAARQKPFTRVDALARRGDHTHQKPCTFTVSVPSSSSIRSSCPLQISRFFAAFPKPTMGSKASTQPL